MEEVIKWIIDNREWLFSGVGVTVVCTVVGYFVRRKTKNEEIVKETEVIDSNIISGNFTGDNNIFGNNNTINISSEGKNEIVVNRIKGSFFSERFEIVQKLLNDARCYNEKEFTVEYVSSLIGYKNVGEFKKYVEGEIEPDESLKQKFVDIFCVNRDWMLYNQGKYPFATNLDGSMVAGGYAMDILRKEKLTEISEFIVVIGRYENRRSVLIVRHSSGYCYEVYPEIYNLDMPIGATGRSQLISFYRFLREARRINKLCSLVHKATEEQFMALYKGAVAPMLARTYETYCSFTENFLDLSESGFERDERWSEKSLIDVKKNIQLKLDEVDRVNQSVDVVQIKKNLCIGENDISNNPYYEFI